MLEVQDSSRFDGLTEAFKCLVRAAEENKDVAGCLKEHLDVLYHNDSNELGSDRAIIVRRDSMIGGKEHGADAELMVQPLRWRSKGEDGVPEKGIGKIVLERRGPVELGERKAQAMVEGERP